MALIHGSDIEIENKFQSMNYHLKKEFAITITLKPQYCKDLNHVDQFKIFTPFLVQELDDETQTSWIEHVELVPELTKQNNIHYHGYIRTVDYMGVQTVYSRIRDLLRDTVFGYIWVTHVSDKDGWIKYMNKNPYPEL